MKIPNLKVSDEDKFADNGLWFEQVMKYYLSSVDSMTHLSEAQLEMLRKYKYLNNELDYKDWIRECEYLGIEEDEFNLKGFGVNIIPVIISYLKTVDLKRNTSFTPVLQSQRNLIQKDEELKSKVSSAIEGQITGIILGNQRYQELASQNTEEAQKEMQEIMNRYRENYPIPQIEGYLSEMEILASKIIKYAENSPEIKYKKVKNETLESTVITDGAFVRLVPTYNRVLIQPLNTPFVRYHKSSEMEDISDAEWVSYTQLYTPSMIMSEFPELQDKLDKLGIVTQNVRNVTKDITTFSYDTNRWEQMGYDVPRGHDTGIGSLFNRDRLIPVTHFEFKAFKPVGILKTINAFGEEITEIVDETFEAPKGVKETYVNQWGFENEILKFEGGSLEIIWFKRRYEVTCVGNLFYTRKREGLFQITNDEDPYYCKLTYFGRYQNAYNSKSFSILDRLIPYNLLYGVVYKKFVKLVERWDGYLIPVDLDAIPIELGDGNADEAYKQFIQNRKDGYLIQNSFDERSKSNRPAPAILSADVSNTFKVLIELMNWIKQEMGMIIGVSPQAMSQMISDNVTDNQLAITQTSYMIDPLFQKHNYLWQEIMTGYINMTLEWLKEKVKDGKKVKINYMFGDVNETLELTEEDVDFDTLGIYITNNNPKEYYDLMMQHAHAMVQNQLLTQVDISSLFLSMQSGESPGEVHKKFMKARADQVTREERLNDLKQQELAAQKENNEAMIKLQKEIIDLKEEWEEQHIKTKGEIELRKEAMKVYQFQDNLDVNSNNIPDPIESANLQHKINMDSEKLNLEKQKAVTERRSQLFEEMKHADQLEENEKDRKVILQKNANKPKK